MLALWAAGLLLLLVVVAVATASDDRTYPTSRFLEAVDAGQVAEATLYPGSDRVKATFRNGAVLRVGYPGTDAGRLIDRLRQTRAEVYVATSRSALGWLLYLLPTALFIAFWAWLARRLRAAASPQPPTA